jgi:hypothetical protein
MVRTKHLFITGVLLVGTLVASTLGVLFVHMPTISVATMPAAVVLGMPADDYPVVVDTYNEDTREAFIERVRSEYVPPPPRPEPESEPEPVVYTPPPAPVAAPLPVAIVEEPITTGTTTASTTSTNTLEASGTSTIDAAEISSPEEDSTI